MFKTIKPIEFIGGALAVVIIVGSFLGTRKPSNSNAFSKPTIEEAIKTDCETSPGDQLVGSDSQTTVGDFTQARVTCEKNGVPEAYFLTLKHQDDQWLVINKGQDLPSPQLGRLYGLPPEFTGGD